MLQGIKNPAGINCSAELLTNLRLINTKIVLDHGIQNYCSRAKQMAPKEAYNMLPYSV